MTESIFIVKEGFMRSV